MKPSLLTISAGIAIAVCATVLLALHDTVPQWMPYLAVFLFGHGVGATVPSSIISALAPGGPATTSTTTSSTTTTPAPLPVAGAPAPVQPLAVPQPSAVP